MSKSNKKMNIIQRGFSDALESLFELYSQRALKSIKFFYKEVYDMALIKCPECGKEISDKAPACIHCGFPLSLLKEQSQESLDKENKIIKKSESLSKTGYSMELLDYGNKKIQIATALKSALRINDVEALELVSNTPCYIFKDKSERIAIPIIQKLDTLPVEYKLYQDGILKKHKTKIEIKKQITQTSSIEKTTSYTKKIKCPNCSSFIVETSRECPICGFDGIGSYLLQLEREKQSKIIDYTHDYGEITLGEKSQNVPKCPTCQSLNIKKISTASKVSSVFMWGLFSQKIKKQWHCNNCGYEW